LPRPAVAHWTAWRLPAFGEEPANALLMAESEPGAGVAEKEQLQTQRWEAVGRLAGGVVHDFNNLLTGIMLYCDLLLSNLSQAGLDQRDQRLRHYAEEIRSAIMQATGLVRQLLVFARPKTAEVRALSLNQIARDMQDMLTRLIGENIALDLHLDPNLGLVNIDQAQAQQVLLNLILNARDALPEGGRIVVETSNCNFRTVTDSPLTQVGASVFPCILLTVSDNGCGMDAQTRQRLFEPFFTTKGAGKGTGLGLTTIRSIVTTYRGLIHVESEAGRGTCVMILFPRMLESSAADFPLRASSRSVAPPPTLQEVKKEFLL
jgi:two-component system, cell cycle sensor histidine kinase and response regulator CckA